MAVPYIGYPQVRAHFFTEGKQFVKTGRADYGVLDRSARIPDDRTRDQIVSVTTGKDLESPAGRWSVTLTGADYARGGGLLDMLRLGDLCILEMGPDKPQPTDTAYAKLYTKGLAGVEIVMIGSVDSIREGESYTPEGHVSHTVTVSGRDFGKYLVDDQVWWDHWGDPFGATIGLVNELVEWPKLTLNGKPADVIASILQFWLFRQFDLEFHLQGRAQGQKGKQVRKLSEILRYSLAYDTPAIPFGTTLMSYEGALWNLFQTIQSPPWYVLTLDVRRQQDIGLLLTPHNSTKDNLVSAGTVWNTDLGTFNSQVCLLYYRNPWSNRFYDDWAQLPTRVITDDDVLSADLGRDIEEVHNVWRTLAQSPDRTRADSTAKLPDNLRAREVELFRRFGPRPRMVDTPFFQGPRDLNFIDTLTRMTGELRDWDIHNESLLNGQITMKGMAALRVGDRLWWRSGDGKGGRDFYVESVEQQFQALTSWTTTAHVTRGQIHRDSGQPLFDKDGNTVRSPAVYGGTSDRTPGSGS